MPGHRSRRRRCLWLAPAGPLGPTGQAATLRRIEAALRRSGSSVVVDVAGLTAADRGFVEALLRRVERSGGRARVSGLDRALHRMRAGQVNGPATRPAPVAAAAAAVRIGDLLVCTPGPRDTELMLTAGGLPLPVIEVVDLAALRSVPDRIAAALLAESARLRRDQRLLVLNAPPAEVGRLRAVLPEDRSVVLGSD